MPAMTTSRTSGAQAAMNRARNGPTLTQVPLASLKSSAMRPSKSKPHSKSIGIGRLERVAELIKPLLVKGGVPSSPAAASSPGVTFGPLRANLELAIVGNQLGVVAGTGSPT